MMKILKNFANRINFLLLITLILVCVDIQAQQPKNNIIGRKNGEVIEVDLSSGEFIPNTLPFDVPFKIKGKVPKEIVQVSLIIRDNKCKPIGHKPFCQIGEKDTIYWKRNFLFDTGYFYMTIPPLDANSNYQFEFNFSRLLADTEKTQIKNIIANCIGKTMLINFTSNENEYKEAILNDKKSDEALTFLNLYNGYEPTIEDKIAAVIEDSLIIYSKKVFYNENFLTQTYDIDYLINDIEPFISYYKNLFLNSDKFTTNVNEANKAFFNPTQIAIIDNIITNYKVLGIKDTMLNNYRILKNSDVYAFLTTGQLNPRINIVERIPTKLHEHYKSIDIDQYINNIKSSWYFYYEMQNNINDIIKSDILGKNNSSIKLTKAELENINEKINDLEPVFFNLATMALDYKNSILKIENPNSLTLNITGFDFGKELSGNSTNDYVTRTEYYVTGDVGIANIMYGHSFEPNYDFQPYFGVNFNFLPVNRQKKYNIFSWDKHECILKPFSGVIGVTLNPIKSDDSLRLDLWSKMSLLTGLGIRISDPIRLTTGLIWFKQKNDNPLITNYYLTSRFYISLSFDIDVIQYLGNVGDLLFPGHK